MSSLEIISETRCFGGVQGFYRHQSDSIGLPMRFGVFQPPRLADAAPVVLFYLAGLTCTEETFFMKAGAQHHAAQLGLMLVSCDTSPRSTGIPGEADDWEFGSGAGFYLNATEAPWAKYFRMYDYVNEELPAVITGHFSCQADRMGILGHSMGGHGALVIAIRNPDRFRSVSAFAPISAPSRAPWGMKAFPKFLGTDQSAWARYDAAALLEHLEGPVFDEILIDQGLADKFLAQSQLLPEALEQSCQMSGQPLRLRRHQGYDHGYYFVASFIEEHLRFHRRNLRPG